MTDRDEAVTTGPADDAAALPLRGQKRRAALRMLARGGVAAMAMLMIGPDQAQGAAVAEPAADHGPYHGPIRTILSDEVQSDAPESDTVAAIVLRLASELWPARMRVNVTLVPLSHRTVVEQWARRQLGAGGPFGVLEVGELALI